MPSAGAGRAVVQIAAAALNPIDLLISSGKHPVGPPPYPHVPGVEGVGRVVSSSALAVGSRVRFQILGGFVDGSLAEFVVVDEAACQPVPDEVSAEVAAAVGVVGIGSLVALRDRGRLSSGETVLVLGASGAFGQAAAQVARALGAGRVIAAGRDASRLDVGADAILDTSGEIELDNVDVVFDPLWGPYPAMLLPHLAAGGRWVNVGQAAGRSAEIDAELLRHKGAVITGLSGAAIPPAQVAAAYQEICEHRITPRLETFPLDRVDEAWKAQQASPGCKLVIVP